jgi:hypothetical protein
VLKALERAKLAKARGKGDFASGYPDWLVVWEEEGQPLLPSPLFRTWRVYAYRDEADLAALLGPVRRYLQTAAVACGPAELLGLAHRLWSLGVNRVVEAAARPSPPRARRTTADSSFPSRPGSCRWSRRRAGEASGSRARRTCRSRACARSSRLRRLLPATADASRKQACPAGASSPGSSSTASPGCARRTSTATDRPARATSLPCRSRRSSAHTCSRPAARRASPATAFTAAPNGTRAPTSSAARWDPGPRASDRVANLFNSGGLWSAFLAISRALEKLGCLNLPLGGNVEPEKALQILGNLRATAVFGLPATILRLAHAAEARPELRVPLRMILYGGEHMSEPMRAYVARIFGAELVKSGSYAAVDAGIIGYQCLFASGGVHHALETYCHVEICDESTAPRSRPARSARSS